ncbi:hypothetical protein JCM13304A_04100 [Desulfothermus okinawensis JCM 13304]
MSVVLEEKEIRHTPKIVRNRAISVIGVIFSPKNILERRVTHAGAVYRSTEARAAPISATAI